MNDSVMAESNESLNPATIREWKQPFLQYRFTARDVASVLAHTRLFELGSRRVEASIDAIRRDRNSSDEKTNETRQVRDDYWGRDEFLRLRGEEDGKGTLIFVNDLDSAWDKAVLDNSSLAPMSKKKKMDAVVTSLYVDNVLSKTTHNLRLKYMVCHRACLALAHYCTLRGWVFGRDVLFTNVGGSSDCVPAYVKDAMPRDVFPMHMYEVATKDTSPQTLKDVELIMLHVTYAVEREMRENNRSSESPFNWIIPESAFSDSSEQFREIDSNITSVGTLANGSNDDHKEESARQNTRDVRRDSGMWSLRDNESSTESVVIKTVDCLAWSKGKRNDESTVQGFRRKIRDTVAPESSLYVSCAWPCEASDLRDMNENDAVRIKMKYDVRCTAVVRNAAHQATENDDEIVEGDEGDEGVECGATHSVRCSADVLTIRVLGPTNPKRVRDLEAVAMYPRHAFVCIDGVFAPTLLHAWTNEFFSCFGWLNYDHTIIDPDVARAKAQRMIWTTISFEVHTHQRMVAWQWAGYEPPRYECITGVLSMLNILICALNVSDGVTLCSVQSLSPPFVSLLSAINDTCSKKEAAQHREWIKAVFSGAATSASASFCMPSIMDAK